MFKYRDKEDRDGGGRTRGTEREGERDRNWREERDNCTFLSDIPKKIKKN